MYQNFWEWNLSVKSVLKLLKCTDKLEKCGETLGNNDLQLESQDSSANLGQAAGAGGTSMAYKLHFWTYSGKNSQRQNNTPTRTGLFPSPTSPPPLVNLFMPCFLAMSLKLSPWVLFSESYTIKKRKYTLAHLAISNNKQKPTKQQQQNLSS